MLQELEDRKVELLVNESNEAFGIRLAGLHIIVVMKCLDEGHLLECRENS